MAPTRMPEAVIGLDVGKSSHWACVATRDGEVLLSTPVANREDDLDSLFGRFPDALVVVDQSRNIGALALARARAAGMSAAYLPELAAHGAARLFAGDAKTDERDAMVIAKTALGIPRASILFRANVLRVACLCLRTVLGTFITTTSDKWTIVTVASADKCLDL